MDAMATAQRNPTTRESIQKCNEAVSRRFHMTLAVYKTIKVVGQTLGVGAGIYAMSLGADPMTSLVIVGAILVGPEVLEYSIANGNGNQED